MNLLLMPLLVANIVAADMPQTVGKPAATPAVAEVRAADVPAVAFAAPSRPVPRGPR